MCNEAFVKELVEKAIKEHNRLDVLVNNAGMIEFGTIETTSMEQYDRVMNINLRSIYQLTMLSMPYLVATKGKQQTNETLTLFDGFFICLLRVFFYLQAVWLMLAL